MSIANTSAHDPLWFNWQFYNATISTKNLMACPHKLHKEAWWSSHPPLTQQQQYRQTVVDIHYLHSETQQPYPSTLHIVARQSTYPTFTQRLNGPSTHSSHSGLTVDIPYLHTETQQPTHPAFTQKLNCPPTQLYEWNKTWRMLLHYRHGFYSL